MPANANRLAAFRAAMLLGALLAARSLNADVPLVFVSRTFDGEPGAAARTGPVARASRGTLVFRDSANQDHDLINASRPGGVSPIPLDALDPDVSWDGRRVVFAGYSAEEEGWRIYEVGLRGSDVRQVTTSERPVDLMRHGEAEGLLLGHDDLDPCYLPDGRICFVSTRYPGLAPDGRHRTTNLYVVNANGTGLHRITTERFGADTPAVDPVTGRIVYSRWWRSLGTLQSPPVPPGSPAYGGVGQPGVIVDPEPIRPLREDSFPGVNHWFLASINPDGTDLAMFSGFGLDRQATQAYRPTFLPSGQAVALFIPRTPVMGVPGANGLRVLERGPEAPHLLGGPQDFGQTSNGRGQPALYSSVAALPGNRFLVTATSPMDPDYEVYFQTFSCDEPPGCSLTSGFTFWPGTERRGSVEMDAVPVLSEPRPLPPIIPDRVRTILEESVPRTIEEAFRLGGSFTFICENIHFNAPVDVAIPSAPPVGHGLAIEFYMAPQGTSRLGLDPPQLIHRMQIGPEGRVAAELPAGVPLFEVLRLPDGNLARGRDGQIFHVGSMNFGRAGERARCVGCHAGHSMMPLPDDPAWTNLAPSANVTSKLLAPRMAPAPVVPPQVLVDRRTDMSWPGGEFKETPEVQLRWRTLLRARTVVLHAPNFDNLPQDLGILSAKVRALRGQETVFETTVGLIRLGQPGPAIEMDPPVLLDSLVVTILSWKFAPALTEIEVLSQPAGARGPTFRRGDVDCSGQAPELADAIGLLQTLFLGGPAPCCAAAADTNGDTLLDVSDVLTLLGYLFLGGSAPPEPFASCGQAPGGQGSALSCARSCP